MYTKQREHLNLIVCMLFLSMQNVVFKILRPTSEFFSRVNVNSNGKFRKSVASNEFFQMTFDTVIDSWFNRNKKLLIGIHHGMIHFTKYFDLQMRWIQLKSSPVPQLALHLNRASLAIVWFFQSFQKFSINSVKCWQIDILRHPAIAVLFYYDRSSDPFLNYILIYTFIILFYLT